MFQRGFALSGCRFRAPFFACLLTMAALSSLSGCGGSSKFSSSSVVVTASVKTVDGSNAVTLTATVANDKNSAGVTWTVSGGGTLSNTTTTSATFTAPAATTSAQIVTVTATSVADTATTGNVTLTVPAKPAITPPGSAQLTGAVGAPYSLQLTGSGGIAPYMWTLTAGTLPTGWTLTTGGLLSGPAPVAGQAGIIDLTLTMTDSGTPTALIATLPLVVNIDPAPAITFAGVMPATTTYGSSSPYSGFATATGGASPLTYSISSGSFPPGLGLISSVTGEVGGQPTAAGTYNFTIKAADAYGDSATQPYTITVNPGAATLAFTAIPIHTYGDAAFGVSATSASAASVTYSVTGGPATINSSSGLVTLTGAGTVNLKASQAASGNYAAATATTSFTVNKGTATVTLSNLEQTYTGSALSATVTTNPAGLTVNLTYGGSSTVPTGAGSYAVVGTISDVNYTGSANGILVIAKAMASITVTPYTATYDGNLHTATATATGVGGVNLIADLTLTGTAHTGAGSYSSDAWSFSDSTGNYASASGTVSDTISKATATITVTPYTVTYDGNQHSAVAIAKGVGAVTLSATDFTLTGTAHTNAGTYLSDAWSFADPNYVSASGTVLDTISPAAATIVVMPYTVTYDGNPHSATATAIGAGGANLIANLNLTGTAHTNAGTYAGDTWSFSNSNYVSANGTVSDTINQATPALSFEAIAAHTYGNTAFTASATSASSGAVTYSLTSGPATINNSTGLVTITGAGTVVLGASQAATANYTVATASITFTVSQAVPTIVVTPYNVTYDGAPRTASAMATGVGGVTLSPTGFTLTSTTHTNAGSYTTDAWSFADPSGNYTPTNGTISDKIGRATATINITPYTVTYDATAHTATGTATGLAGANLAAGLTLSGTTHANAGSYSTDAWSFTDASGNYANASGTVSDKINQATATAVVTPYTVTYDGNAHSATATATGVGGTSLSASDFTLTGTAHTNAGTYGTDAWSFADPNYVSQGGTVSDKINPATPTIIVTPYTISYDGNSHTAPAAATGVGGVNLIADLNVTGTTHTNAGSYPTDPWSFIDPLGNYVNSNGTVSDTINKSNPAVVMVNIPDHTFGDPNFTVTAISPSDGVITYTVDTGPATINSSTGLVTLTGVGMVGVTAHQAASTNYNASVSAQAPFHVYAATAVIVITPYSVTYDGTPHTASATAKGVGGVTLSPTGFTMTGTTHTNVGNYTTDAWSFSDASGNYANANGVVTDKINGAAPGLAFSLIPTKVFGTPPAGDAPFTVSATTASAGAITYSVASGPASIIGNTVTLTGTGMVTLDASQVANGNYAAATASISFQVNPALSITTTTLPTGAPGVPYSQQLQGTGGSGSYTWVTDGAGSSNLSLIGLNLSLSGLVSGPTPIDGGPETFTPMLTDSSGHMAQATLSVTISSITITTTSLPTAYTGSAYSQQLLSVGGAGGNVWTVSGASNLATYGLTLSTSGLLSGTLPGNAPTGTSIINFTAQVKDKNNLTATKLLTSTVYNPLTLPSAGALHAAITGADYTVNNVGISASGGSGHYSFSVNGTSIPLNWTQVTIASADSLTGYVQGSNTMFLGGTPTNSGTITLNVTVTDTGVTPNTTYGPIQYTIIAAPQQPLTLPNPNTNPLPTTGNINQSYNGGINASGGANGVNYSFSVQIGGATTTIPNTNNPVALTNGAGLTAQNSGGNSLIINGTPNTAGHITLLVTVNDSANDPPASQGYTINIVNPTAGYDVSGTVDYSGTQTGWIYLQLVSNNCGNCRGPGVAIPAKGPFTIKGVQNGNYSLQAYMDPNTLGYGAQNASDPTGGASNINVSNGALSGASVTLADPGTITLGSAPSISVAGAFATGAFVQLSNTQSNNNGVEMASSYTVRWSLNSSFSPVAGSKSFPATGGNGAPFIVSGLTNGQTYYFEVQAVAGSSTSGWSAPTAAVQIAATPASGNNAVSGTVTFPTPDGGITGPLYAGVYDQNTGRVYATVVANPLSPQSYSLNVPTGNNYLLFGVIDQKNNGLMSSPGQISNVSRQSNSAVAISGTTINENFTLPTNTAGTAPKNSTAVIRTQHNRQTNSNGTSDNYNIDFRIDGVYKLPVSVEVTTRPIASTVVVPSDWATAAFHGNNNEFDFQPNLNGGTPQVGDTYNVLVTYSDTTSETLTLTVGTVLNAFARLNTPAALSTNVSPTPNFSWTDPANASNYAYQFQLQDSNYNSIWRIPGNNSRSDGFSNSITSIAWGTDPTGGNSTPTASSLNSLTTYQWSIQATDANGNSTQEMVSFDTGEASLTLPDNSTPGSALINQPYSQSLNASGGSGSGYVFTVNGSAGTTNAGTTTWPLGNGLTASSSTNSSNQLTVSGTPTSVTTVTFTVSVKDSQNNTDTQGTVTYTINVINGPNGAHNSYLNGTYVCKTDGFFDSDGSRWTTLSSVQLAGNGTLTGVFDMNGRDINALAGTTTGTYSVGSDNNGLATIISTITGTSGTTSSQWALALSNLGEPGSPAQEFRMVESDDLGASPSGKHATADCHRATTGAFTASTLNGKSFAFGMQGENSSGTSKAYAGRFSASSQIITVGILDGMRVDQSADAGGTFDGSYTTVSGTSGRFTLTFTPTGSPDSMVLAGYVIDSNRMLILETAGDNGVLAGEMRTQQQNSYSGANLNGNFVLYMQSYRYSNGGVSGYDSNVFQGNGNGAGNFTINQSYQDDQGTYKVGDAKGGPIPVTFDPTYAGRSSFVPGNDTIYLYFFDNNAAFELDLGSNYLESGWVEPQTQTIFTNAALAGTYLLGQMPPMQDTQHANIGELTLLSNGNITGGTTEAGPGDFSYDQSLSMSYNWDSTSPGTGTFLIGSGDKGVSCAVISATKAVCINNADSSPSVMVLQQ